MSVKKLERNFFQRLLGLCATPKPSGEGSWKLQDGLVEVDLSKTPELQSPGGAVRLQGGGLEAPVLVINGSDGEFHAFRNVCTHGKRALDPVPGTATVQCCSVGASTFSYDGELIEGPAKGPLTVYRVEQESQRLKISV
ncbi:Rieske 2Fe-2S domain-containing protein [Prosthecochloris sp. N3]|uniref:Rieske 2Fe-2S domain-containing protein n=1 Tax=Prosthecochloris ethylica TaxID=2743976 RepID=A0ABR9XPS8_9CHLB|nr:MULTISPECIES: Rieske 2Fe-2S domain-containing protein [Prosthecochloris]MEC9487716.1 Rieske 2Fe-2S domain-containing protein [Prosthecochloris sp.]MBF0587261.1 Rieske 2Fe-2S domain-containing protein [Prosthecochloris ethylica]MBF0636045.1 Rieske 2Fe-2S domain-containing protein [Prosthecochloris ethylica]NUK48472.1 Rieske 2Fe-2S domain-containing protein [Prosthecochloris ethylica]RNA64460.1 Rieske (2Fe-2S) protein [Prosthecochloris sp. ZM_2]